MVVKCDMHYLECGKSMEECGKGMEEEEEIPSYVRGYHIYLSVLTE